MPEAGRATVKFVGDYSSLMAGLTSSLAPGSLKSVGLKAGGALAAGFVASKAVDELMKAVSVTKEFDKELSSLQAVTRSTGRQMERLRKQAIDMGAATTFSASEAAKAQTELAKGGLTASQILGGALRSSLNLAAAGELELADAAETTVNAMQLFGLEGAATARIADMLATAANRTTADVLDFSMALKQGGSVAKTAGYSLNDTVVILEALAEAGIKNSDAGTSMKAALIQLLNPTAKQAKLANELGVAWLTQNGELKNGIQISRTLRAATSDMTKAERTKTLAILAGTDGFRTLSSLYDAGVGKLRKYSRANQEQGTAADTARTKTDNLAGDVEELSGAYETLQIKVGTLVTPALRELTQAGTAALRWLADMNETLDDTPVGDVKSWTDHLGSAFEFSKGLGQLWFGDIDGGFKRMMGAFSGSPEEISRLKAVTTARVASAQSLARISGVVNRARGRVASATDAERMAEKNLRQARRRFGDGSDEVLRAEIQLQRAKRKTIRLTREAKLAERLQGVERRVTASRTRDQVVLEKTRIGTLNRSIRTLGRKWEAERRNNGNTKLSRELEGKIIAKIKEREKTQKRLNNVLGDAARQIGPKFAKSLQNISGKAATMEAALGRLPRPTNRVKSALGQLPPVLRRFSASSGEELGAAQKDMERLQGASGLLRRIYNRNIGRSLPDATDTGMGRIQDLLRENIDAIQNTGVPQAKRRGGLVEKVRQRFRKGGVPVAVSSGELFKTPDGKWGSVPGQPTASDNVLTTMPVGTKVFTFDGQRRLMEGASESEALRSQLPHFASGGIVKPKIVGGTERGAEIANAAVGKVHDRAKAKLKKLRENMISGGNIVAVGRSLQRMGYEVGEHPAFGGVAPVHTDGSFHYQGRAIDVNDDVSPRFGSEMASLDWLYGQLKNKPHAELLWRVADHYDHLHFAMRGGGRIGDPSGFRWRHGHIEGFEGKRLKRLAGVLQALYTGGQVRVVKNVGRFLMQRGFDHRATAGILGNAYREGLWNPSQMEYTGLHNGGLYGFTTSPVSLQDVKNFAARRGKKWDDAILQTNFMLSHGQPTGMALRGEMNAANEIPKATEIFMEKWEKPGVPALADRVKAAFDASKIMRDAGINGEGKGMSAAEKSKQQRKRRREAREAQVQKLIQRAFAARSSQGKKGAFWQVLDLYAKFGDFGVSKGAAGAHGGVMPDGKSFEAVEFLQRASSAASVLNPQRGSGQLYSLVKWLQGNVDMTGTEKANDAMSDRLKKVREAGGGRAQKRRQKLHKRLAKYGTDFPWKEALNKNARTDEILDDLSNILSRDHQAEWSEFGSEYSPAELKKEQGVLHKLFATRDNRYRMLMRAIPWAEKAQKFYEGKVRSASSDPAQKWMLPGYRKGLNSVKGLLNGGTGNFSLREDLKTLVGASGVAGLSIYGGTRGDAFSRWQELLGTKSGGGAGVSSLDLSGLLQIVEFARYGGYDALPKFHSGGVIPGPRGQEVPIMAQAGETVVPNGGLGDVKVEVNFADGMGWLKDFVDVRVSENGRRSDQMMKAGVR